MLNRLLRRAPRPETLRPDTDVVVIGDVHGCALQLSKALEDAGGRTTVLVGDYVDRGPDSAVVLDSLRSRPDLICLCGNHEEMLLRFVDAPTKVGAGWLRHGGTATLASFGITSPADPSDDAALTDTAAALADAMGPDRLEWLRALPDRWMSGNVAIVHAAANPDVPIEAQQARHLRWGHDAFFSKPRKDGIWVVHGHTVVPEPSVKGGRIAIDTGAFATGRLTAAYLETGRVGFRTYGYD